MYRNLQNPAFGRKLLHPEGFTGPWTAARQPDGCYRYYDSEGKMFPAPNTFCYTESKKQEHLDQLNASWDALQRGEAQEAYAPYISKRKLKAERMVGNLVRQSGYPDRFPLEDVEDQLTSRDFRTVYSPPLLKSVDMREPVAPGDLNPYSEADLLRILSRADEQGNRLAVRLFLRMWQRQTESEQRAGSAHNINNMGFAKGDAFLARKIFKSLSPLQLQGREPVDVETHALIVALLQTYRRQLRDMVNQAAASTGVRVRTNRSL